MTAIKESRYDAVLDVAFALAKEAVATKRKVVEEDPRAGMFRTDWEAIVVGRPGTSPTAYRVRFEVALVGPKPWRVEVKGVIEGAVATSPTWLAMYEDKIHADVHDSLKAHLVQR